MNPIDEKSPGMWASWQETVRASMPNFARCPIFVEQNSVSVEKFREVAKQVQATGEIDIGGKTRDREFGARVVETCLGDVTRMWLDGNIEIDFLFRNLPKDFSTLRVLDIGAGYGRLAVMLKPLVQTMACVDAVPISTEICRFYCLKFAPDVEVYDLADFTARHESMEFDVVLNVHSWNECTLEQIENWLAVIKRMKIPYLFTVSHGQLSGTNESAYRSWSEFNNVFWRTSIERDFDLVAEESLGLSNNPHAVWRRKE